MNCNHYTVLWGNHFHRLLLLPLCCATSPVSDLESINWGICIKKPEFGVGFGLFIQLKLQRWAQWRRQEGLQVKVRRQSPFSYKPAALAEGTGDLMSTVTPRFWAEIRYKLAGYKLLLMQVQGTLKKNRKILEKFKNVITQNNRKKLHVFFPSLPYPSARSCFSRVKGYATSSLVCSLCITCVVWRQNTFGVYPWHVPALHSNTLLWLIALF